MKGNERKGGGGAAQAAKKQQQSATLGPPANESSAQPTSASQQNNSPTALNTAKSAQQQQKHVYSEPALRNNFQVLEQSRTCQAAVSGIASGILGLTGTMGFVFYFLCVLIQAFVWDYKANFQWGNYFVSRSLLATHSLVGGLFTYVLFWVFVYGLVHVY